MLHHPKPDEGWLPLNLPHKNYVKKFWRKISPGPASIRFDGVEIAS